MSTILSLLLLALISFPLADPAGAQMGSPESKELLEMLSKELGVPAVSLQVISQSPLHLRYLDQRVTVIRLYNRDTHEGSEVVLDASGKKVDGEALLDQDRAVKKARFGNLDPPLHAHLETKGGSDPVEVSIWLAFPEEMGPRPTPEEYEEKGAEAVGKEIEARLQQRRLKLAAVEEPFIEKIKTMGGENLTANDLSPIISARLTKDRILSLSTLPEIDTIYLGQNQGSVLNRP